MTGIRHRQVNLTQVTIEAGSATGEFRLPVPYYSNYRTDAVFEVEVVVGVGARYRVPADAEAISIPIRDVDIPTVSIEAVQASVDESQQCALFRLVHSNTDGFIGSDARLVNVVLTITEQGDYLSGEQELQVVMLGATDGPTKTVCVPLDDDAADEADGSLTATISLAEGGRFAQVARDASAATVAVTDDDLPVVSLSTAASEVAEGDEVSFTATRAGELGGSLEISVDYGIGAAPATEQALTFAATEGSTTFSLSVEQDTVLQVDRHLTVLMQEDAEQGWRVADQASSIELPIVDDDRALASVSALSRTVVEGSGCAGFTLSVSNVSGLGASAGARLGVVLTISEQGSYLSGSSSMTVSMEGASRSFCVALDDDATAETDGSITVTIDGGANVQAASGAGTATVAVSDDDGTPPAIVSTATVAITSDAGSDSTYAIGDRIEVTATFSEAVTVTGAPQLVLGIGDGTRVAGYASSAGQAVVFGYLVQADDEDSDGITVAANGLQPNGGMLGLTGAPRLTALSAQSGHLVDGVRPVVSSWDEGDAEQAVVNEPLLLTVTMSETVTGLTVEDFTVRNGAASDLVRQPAVAGDLPTWTLKVTPAGAGEVVVELAAGGHEDAVGNAAAASAAFRIAARKQAVTVRAVSASIIEGADARFTLSREIGDQPLTVAVEVTEQSGAGNETSRQEVSFAARVDGQASTATLVISTTNDRVDEADRTISVRVLDGAAYVAGQPGAAAVTVADDDAPTVVSLSGPTTLSRVEGRQVRIPFVSCIESDVPRENPLTVHLRVSVEGDVLAGHELPSAPACRAGRRRAGEDHSNAKQAAPSTCCSTPPTTDFEPPGSVTVEVLRPANAGYVTGRYRRDTVSGARQRRSCRRSRSARAHAEVARGRKSRVSTLLRTEGRLPGRPSTSDVLLKGELVDPATATIGGAADLGDGARIPVMFATGRTSVELLVPTVDDDENEGVGAITLYVHESTGGQYLLGSPARATAHVADDDLPVVTIATTATEVTEGGELTLTASRDGTTAGSQEITVRSAAPDEYGTRRTALTQVTIEAGSATGEFRLPVPYYSNYRTDAVFEVEVVVGVGARYRVPADAEAISISILDVDTPTVSIEAVQASVDESQQCALFRLVHSNTDGFIGSDERLVNVVLTITEQGDYLSGEQELQVVMLGATDGPTKTVCVPLDDDAADEADGSLTATISLAAGGRFARVPFEARAATVTVTDDDLPVVSLSTAASEVAEGDEVSFTATRAGELGGSLEISVDYGIGAAPATEQALTFAATEGSTTFSLSVEQDTVLQVDRHLTVLMQEDAEQGWRVADQASGIELPIVDDDRALASVSALSRTVVEGSGCAGFTLSVSNVSGLGASAGARLGVVLTISEQGSYLSGSSSMTVSMEGASRSFCVALDDDATAETDGSITVTIDGGANVQAASGAGTATVAVSDDDGTPPAIVSTATVAITSDAGSDSTYAIGDRIEVTATFSEAVTVTGAPQLVLGIGDGTRVAGYASSAGQEVVFGYLVQADDEDSDGITVAANGLQPNGGMLGLTGAPRLTALSAQSGHLVDGVRPVVSSWDEGDAEQAVVNEPLLLTVTMSETVTGLTVEDFTVRNGAASDLVRQPAVAGDLPTWTLKVTPAGAGEVVVELAAGGHEDAVGNAAAASAAFRIAARKQAVTVRAVSASIIEGADARFTLSREIGDQPLTVAVEVTEQSGAGNETSRQEVSFAARVDGQASTATLVISTTNDRVDEADRTISVRVLDGAAYVAGQPGAAAVTVADDDAPTVVSLLDKPAQAVVEGRQMRVHVLHRVGVRDVRAIR